MTTRTTQAQRRAAPCPTCGAGAGEPCEAALIPTWGRARPKLQREHSARVTLARAFVPTAEKAAPWALYCRIGGAHYLGHERVRWGWARGNRVHDGGDPEELDEAGECLASELPALVESYAGELQGCPLPIRDVTRNGRMLVVYDEGNDAWWLTGLVPTVTP